MNQTIAAETTATALPHQQSSTTGHVAASTSNATDEDTSLHPFVTQKLVDTSKYYCPFLERGFCRESARCNFSHDNRESTKIPIDFCHFYLANKCLYGQDCKFIHNEPFDHDLGHDLPDVASISLTDANHNDHDGVYLYNYDYTCDENSNPDILSDVYSSQSPNVPNNIDQSIRLESHSQLNQGATTSSASLLNRDKSIAASSSISSHHDNKSKLDTDIKQTSSPSSNLSVNLLSIRAYIAGSSRNDSTSTRNSPKATTETGKNATAPKAWQGNRLLASLKGGSANNQEAQLKDLPLCPYAVASGGCPYPEGVCTYLHGQVCDLCCMQCLHPYDEAQRRQHRDDCLREHEREMELSFAVQRSKDKICGICMETVVEKKPITSSRFGVLEKCNHIFCLDCIRKWRGSKQFDSKTIRACPECRVNSDFVVPSKYWIEDQDDKNKLIRDYKSALRSKPCRYFNEGMGECPFAGSCFYKHAYPDGRLAKMEAPKPRRRAFGGRAGGPTLTDYVLWSLIRSFGDDESSNEDESDSRYYMEDDEYYDDDDERVNNDDDDDDDAAEIAEYTAPIW